MKYAFTLAALAALAAAQELPSCATDCIRDAAEAETTCTWGDWDCLCLEDNRNAVTAAGTQCVIGACGVDTALNEVVPAITAICAAAGGGGGGVDTPTPSPSDDGEDDATSTPPSVPSPTPSGEVEESPAPSAYPPPAEESSTSAYAPPPAPSHTGNDTIPEPSPSHPPAAGAGKAGFMGAAAMIGLAALAL